MPIRQYKGQRKTSDIETGDMPVRQYKDRGS